MYPNSVVEIEAHTPPGEIQTLVQTVPLASRQPDSWIIRQPEGCWFQFSEGAFELSVQTRDSTLIQRSWTGAVLTLLYHDTMTRVPTTQTLGTPVFKELSKTVRGDILTYMLKIDEITKNHQSRAFCFSLALGEHQVTTNEFLVKTKRTKHKRNMRRHPGIHYKTKVCEIVQQLQWKISGYHSTCDGFTDFQQPLYVCSICNGQQRQGHFVDCPILALLQT